MSLSECVQNVDQTGCRGQISAGLRSHLLHATPHHGRRRVSEARLQTPVTSSFDIIQNPIMQELKKGQFGECTTLSSIILSTSQPE